MTEKNDHQIALDLAHLAVHRAHRGVESVLQLIGNDRLKYSITMAVAASILDDCAKRMREGMKHQNGKPPTKDEAFFLVVADIADVCDIRTEPFKKSRKAPA